MNSTTNSWKVHFGAVEDETGYWLPVINFRLPDGVDLRFVGNLKTKNQAAIEALLNDVYQVLTNREKQKDLSFYPGGADGEKCGLTP